MPGCRLGCLLFGAATWKIGFRDKWIGRQPDTRECNPGLICNNTRFLILDYTHAKQNINIVKKIISDALKLSEREKRKLSAQVRDLLWNGNIKGIAVLIREKLHRRLSENALFPKLCVIRKKLSSEVSELARLRYQVYACGNFFDLCG